MTKNPTPVLLDRLAHALGRHGLKLRRQQLLETAAHAFGCRSSDEFSAAMKDGSLAIPAVGIVGSIALPDGTRIVVVTDPLADAPYAIDESFVERVVSEERRESIGVTPYGHLVDISALPDAGIPTLAVAASTTANGGDALAPFLVAALTAIDEEIETRRAGGDPEAWRELSRISDLGHAAVRRAGGTAPLADGDPDSIRISRDDLGQVLGAAESWAEDLESGLADGTYEDDAGIDDVSASIETLRLRLAMAASPQPAPAAPEPAAAGTLRIHVGVVTHRHGENRYLALDRDDLDRQMAEYCRECWDQVADWDDVPANVDGMTDAKIVETYFDAMIAHEGREYRDLDVEELKLPPGHPLATAADDDCVRCGSPVRAGRCADETCPFHDVAQDDRRGWADHPEPPIARPGVAATTSPDDDRLAIAAILEQGATDDIWYDAGRFGGTDPADPDRIAESRIETVQNAMAAAAWMLRGAATASGPSPTRRHPPATDARPVAITDVDGDETGLVTVAMLADARLQYGPPDAELRCLTDRERGASLAGETLNAHLDHPVRMGATVLWQGAKWLAPSIEFAFDAEQGPTRDEALAAADAWIVSARPRLAALGIVWRIDADATDSSHEVELMIPVDLALESATADDWRDALSDLLMTDAERASRPRVTCVYRAQADVGRDVVDVHASGDARWDATFDALRWGADAAVAVIDGSADADAYALSPLAPAWIRERSASHPFEVRVDGLAAALRLAL